MMHRRCPLGNCQLAQLFADARSRYRADRTSRIPEVARGQREGTFMRNHLSFSRLSVIALTLLASFPVPAEISITLNSTFIERYKNRATIDAKFTIDHSKGKPNPASKDGDMHVAGRDAKNIGMPTVARS